MTTFETRAYVGQMYQIYTLANKAVKKSLIPNYNEFSVKIVDADILHITYALSLPTKIIRHNSEVRERITSHFPSVVPLGEELNEAHFQKILDVIVHDIQQTAHGELVLDKVNIWCKAYIEAMANSNLYRITNPLETA